MKASSLAAIVSQVMAGDVGTASTPAPVTLADIAAREEKLLSAGNDRMMSPLEVKRRLKNKTQGQSLALRHQFMARSSLSRTVDSAGHVRVETLERLSEKLRRNAASLTNGPGLPTSIAVHSKFITIGTSRSLVIVFDHFQEVRQVLNPSAGSGQSDGPVTAIDVSQGTDFAVCGYYSGRVILWDIMTGGELKVAVFHQSPVTSVRFCSNTTPSVLTVDTTGRMNMMQFTKFFRWGVESKSVLDGDRLGQLVAVARLLPTWASVLSPPSSLASSFVVNTPTQGLGQVAAVGTLVAFSTREATYVMSTLPEIKIVFIWEKPSDVPPGSVPSLTWGFARIHGSASMQGKADSMPPVDPSTVGSCPGLGVGVGFPAPVLARGWGRHLQLLQVHPGGGYGAEFTTVRFASAAPAPGAAGAAGGDTVMQDLNGAIGGASRSSIGSKKKAPRTLDFVVSDDLESTAPIVACAWLGGQTLVYMTSDFDVAVLDTLSLVEVELFNVASMHLSFDTYRPSAEAGTGTSAASTASMDDSPLNYASFQNTFRSCDDSLYLLGAEECRRARVQSWEERVEALVDNSEWLSALALSLDNYDACATAFRESVEAAEKKAKAAAAKGGEPYDPFKFSRLRSNPVTTDVNDRLERLLMMYVRLMFANVPEDDRRRPSAGAVATTDGGKSWVDTTQTLVHVDHYHLLAGVCIDYCVAINRTDLLFGPIFDQFQREGRLTVLLELLEPYILNDKLHYLTPVVMQAFVEHYETTGQIASVERCILHMDTTSMDIDTAVRLTLSHRLFSAFVHVVNHGLHDFTTPIDVLLAHAIQLKPEMVQALMQLKGIATTSPTTTQPSFSGSLEDRRNVGLKLLLYIQYCLRGKGFPRGDMERETALTVKSDLLRLLFSDDYSPLPDSVARMLLASSTASGAIPALDLIPGPFPRVQVLALFDLKEFLTVLTHLFDEAVANSVLGEDSGDEAPGYAGPHTPAAEQLKNIVTALVRGIVPFARPPPDLPRSRVGFVGTSPGKFNLAQCGVMGSGPVKLFAVEHSLTLFLFLATQFSRRGSVVVADDASVCDIVEFIATASSVVNGSDHDRVTWQATVIQLLERCPLPPECARAILPTITAKSLYRASLVLNKQANDIPRVIECYTRDEDPAYRALVFDFIDEVVQRERTAGLAARRAAAASGMDSDDDGEDTRPVTTDQLEVLKSTLLDKFSELSKINQDKIGRLVLDLYPGQTELVIDHLNSNPELQFQYMKEVMLTVQTRRPAVDRDGVSDYTSRTHASVSPEMQLRYIKLLCQYEPENVCAYLSGNDGYPLEETLDLVGTKYNIMDAHAYLLERTGDKAGALNLILTSLTASAKSFQTTMVSTVESRMDLCDNEEELLTLCKGSLRAVLQTVEFAISLCKRNSNPQSIDGDLERNDSARLWFGVLDKLVIAQKSASAAAGLITARKTELVLANVDFAARLSHKEFGKMINHVLESMKNFIPLDIVVNKIMADHAKAEFGEFRATILGMLETYKYEQRILRTANNLMEDDVRKRVRVLHRGKARALSGHGISHCTECRGSLGDVKGTVARRRQQIVLFWCGDAFHRSCLGATFHGCPRCNQSDVPDVEDASPAVRRGRRSSRRGTMAPLLDGSLGLSMGAGFGVGSGGAHGDDGEEALDSDDSDAELGGDDRDFLRQLQRARARAKDTRPLVELYEELGLGSSTANVQAMRLNVAVPPPPPDSVQVIRRKKPSLRKVVSTRRK